jgi:hypothetical protein
MLIAALVALALLAVPVSARADTPSPNYLALGDSYTAGPLIPPFEQPYGCLKSGNNYPHLVASAIGLPLHDASCSGATTDDMFSAQGVSPGPNPPQLDALDAGTQIVTLSIGGNDIGFSSIAQDCFTLNPTGTPCQDKYVVNGVDEISRRIDDTAPKVTNVVQAIHTRAPQAKVYVVDYLPILPESGIGCWPLLPIAFNDVPYLRAKEKQLNGMLATVAANNGTSFVEAYDPSIGHDSCEVPGLRWVEPAIPASPAAPVHPNLLGERAYAAFVTGAIEGVPPSTTGLLPPL